MYGRHLLPRWVHCCDDTMSESLGLIDEVQSAAGRNVALLREDDSPAGIFS